jgi:hypothetical protein
LNYPPNICIPSSVKMKMNSKSSSAKYIKEFMDFISTSIIICID